MRVPGLSEASVAFSLSAHPWLKCSICGDWFDPLDRVGAWVLFLCHLERDVFVNNSAVWVSLCAAWQGSAIFLYRRARASVARRTSCGAISRECGHEVPNVLKRKHLEALVEKDERESRRKRKMTSVSDVALLRRMLTPRRPSNSEHSGCTATSAEMVKMLADVESKIGPSHPASILLRTELEEVKKEARWR